jgi:hypothetical protein
LVRSFSPISWTSTISVVLVVSIDNTKSSCPLFGAGKHKGHGDHQEASKPVLAAWWLVYKWEASFESIGLVDVRALVNVIIKASSNSQCPERRE